VRGVFYDEGDSSAPRCQELLIARSASLTSTIASRTPLSSTAHLHSRPRIKRSLGKSPGRWVESTRDAQGTATVSVVARCSGAMWTLPPCIHRAHEGRIACCSSTTWRGRARSARPSRPLSWPDARTPPPERHPAVRDRTRVTSTAIDVGALATSRGRSPRTSAPLSRGRGLFRHGQRPRGINGRKLVMAHASMTAVRRRRTPPGAHVGPAGPRLRSGRRGDGLLLGRAVPGVERTPTFGFATENDWTPAPNLFAAYGSIVSYTSSLGQFAFLAHQLHTTSVGVLATTSRSPQRSARPPSTRSTATASTSATRTSPSPTSAT